MRKLRVYCYSLLILTLLGCALTAKGPPFTAVSDIPGEKGLVYIYQPLIYGKSFHEIRVNDTPITVLKRGGYYPYIAPVGPLEITGIKKLRPGELLPFVTALEPVLRINLDVKSGETYFVKRHGYLVVELSKIPKETALEELRECVLLPDFTSTK